MTEADWLVCTDTQKMLEFIRGRCSARKLRLLDMAGSRTLWDFMLDLRNAPATLRAEQERQANFVRDVFGPLLFRTVPVDPLWLAWNDGTVVRLAQAIYDERAFDRLPVLADALEEAGCDNADILVHCRWPGEHVRGCWPVDLILGKE
jgi:hypothetical protein